MNGGLDSLSSFYIANWSLSYRTLRERKNAIVKLFDMLGLKPRAGVNVQGKKYNAQAEEDALKKLAKRPPKKIKEIVGDGEEVEVDDAEELSKNDIDAIFTKLPHLFDALVNH